MIEFINVSKYYVTDFGKHYIFRNVSLVIPLDRSVALIGPNGSGKSTFLKLISGGEMPSEGVIRRFGNISPPMGLTPGIQAALNGVENARFAGRVHGLDRDEIAEMLDHVREISQLGNYFDMPVSTYSAGMKQRLAFAINMSLEYDYYLFDEISAGGDKEFRKITKAMIAERLSRSKFMLASHMKEDFLGICDAGIVIKDGELKYFDDVNEALAYYGDEDEDAVRKRVKRRTRRLALQTAGTADPAEAESGDTPGADEPAPQAEAAPALDLAERRRRHRRKMKQKQAAAVLEAPAPAPDEAPAAIPLRAVTTLAPMAPRIRKPEAPGAAPAEEQPRSAVARRGEQAEPQEPEASPSPDNDAADEGVISLLRRAELRQERAAVKAQKALRLLLQVLAASQAGKAGANVENRLAVAAAAQRAAAAEAKIARKLLNVVLSSSGGRLDGEELEELRQAAGLAG